MKHNTKQLSLQVGDVTIIKSDERNRNKWKLGIVEELIAGRDGVVRVAKLGAGKSHLERAVQHLYPLELTCDRTKPTTQGTLNANAPTSGQDEMPQLQPTCVFNKRPFQLMNKNAK